MSESDPAARPHRRSALVTGASSGIGRVIALALACDGFELTLGGRHRGRLDEVAAAAIAQGVRAVAVAGDVVNDDELRTLVERHTDAYGTLDVLVNSAGGGILGRLVDQPIGSIDHQLRLNLRAPIVLTKLALPLLRAAAQSRGKALVVHVGSYAGKAGRELLTAYSAAKHGIIGFAEACNRELSTEGIMSVTLCPTLVDTPLTEPFRKRVDRNEMLAAEDLAEALRFLLRTSSACLVPEIPFQRRGANPFE